MLAFPDTTAGIQSLFKGQKSLDRIPVRPEKKRLRAPLEPVGRAFKAPLSSLVPVTLQERLREEGIEGTVRIQFGDAPGAGRLHLSRAHPLVRLLAEALVDRTR
jgi:hypothetical protein